MLTTKSQAPLLKGYYIVQLVVQNLLGGRGSELGKRGIRVITLEQPGSQLEVSTSSEGGRTPVRHSGLARIPHIVTHS